MSASSPPPTHGWTRADYYANQTDAVMRARRGLIVSEYVEVLPPGRMLPCGDLTVAADRRDYYRTRNAGRPSRAKSKTEA